MFARALALSTVLAMSGCSFVFVPNVNPVSHHSPPPNCSMAFTWPVIDLAISAIALGGLVYFAASDNDHKGLGMIVEGSLAAGFGFSAWYGRKKVNRCRNVQSGWGAY